MLPLLIGLALATTEAEKPAIIMTPTPSFYTADDLLNYHCSSPPQSPNGAVCRAYIIGVADMYRASRKSKSSPICVPLNVSQGEVQAVVIEYLRAHPIFRHDPASLTVRNALIDKWPDCSTNR